MKKNDTTFFCFSPPVMIATFIIESAMLVYTVFRYKMNTLTRLATATLGLLAIFQLAEFRVCDYGNGAGMWARIGFIAITMLPPLGIHLVRVIAGRGPRIAVWLAYLSGLSFAGIFGLGRHAFHSHVCAGNYAIFQLAPHLGGIYFGYYYFWLFMGIGLALYYASNASVVKREALILQAVGFLIFVLPTGIVNDLSPKTISGIPSIMCGFAVLYALLLTFGILPRAAKGKASTK